MMRMKRGCSGIPTETSTAQRRGSATTEDVHSCCAKGGCLGRSNTHEAALVGICVLRHRSARIHLRHRKGPRVLYLMYRMCSIAHTNRREGGGREGGKGADQTRSRGERVG